MGKTSGVRVGVDTGGTFTDVVLMRADGTLAVRKVDNASTDYEANILRGTLALLAETAIPPAAVERIVHCTTVMGNAVIQRKGPRTALITTRGFRDVLELRRQRNPVLYDVFWKKPAPLIPRRLCLEVAERIAADGAIVTPLDLAEARHALRRLVELGIQSAALCLINACVNPEHERRIAALASAEFPGLSLSLSSDISPEWSEYERTSTTVTNAFVKPILRDYLGSLRRRLQAEGIAAPIDVMQSSGGAMPADSAIERPVYCLDSGPAAGVVATCALGRFLGIRDAVTLEMGGTTAKSAIIEDGRARTATETEIGTPVGSDGRSLKGGGYALRIPVIDLAEVGAGGGSIARVDEGGSLAVGPEGAGAVPGPACYGRGGERATVTDANVVLGFLSDEHPLGGEIRVDRGRAAAALEAQIARPLGIALLDAAHAVRTVANAVMARAIRSVSTERGRDVRKFALFASGGGGPGHAADVARMLGIRRVVVPPIPGLFSALGLLWSELEHHYSQAAKINLGERDADARIVALFAALERKAKEAEGLAGGEARIACAADLHYAGQFHNLTVALAGRPGKSGVAARLRQSFEREHRRSFGYASAEEAVEVQALRVTVQRGGGGTARAAAAGLKALMASIYAPRGRAETRSVYFGRPFGRVKAPVLSRGDLTAKPRPGPAIIPEYDSTIVVPPDFTVRREATGSIIMEMKGRPGRSAAGKS